MSVETVSDGSSDGDPDPTDCDDNDAAIYTGASELCDGIDSDCDGSLVYGLDAFYGDGARHCFDRVLVHAGDPDTTDCDDNDAAIYTGATELCRSEERRGGEECRSRCSPYH